MSFIKAERKKARLRLGISGVAGSGKTMGALLAAYGITGDWGKIAVIDTEYASASLYADYKKNGIEIGQFMTATIEAPFEPEKYIALIKEAERAGMEVIIIDSLTHAWAGEGGLLDRQGKVADKTGNSWTAWRGITPVHNTLVNSLLESPCHIIATLRAKQDYVQEKDEKTGKTTIKKVGINPIQRDGMEYEFTTFIDIDNSHTATTSKDRTSLLDGKSFRLGIETGRQLKEWLEKGVESPKLICEDCGNEITAQDGYTAQSIMDGAIKKYGKKLCMDCRKKAGAAKNE